MQHQSGDLYGSLQSELLREFLTFFAGSNHQSFCLITSRAPVADLERFIATFRSHEVERLTLADGKALLRQFDIRLPEMLLDEIVENWRGHVLSLALIGGQLRGRENVMPHEIPVPEANVTEGDRVRSLLRDYNRALSDDERAVLFSVSMFRTAAPVTAVRLIFPEMLQEGSRTSGLDSVIHSLLSRRLIQRVNEEGQLTEHPLIREYYHELLLATQRELGLHIHNRIGEFYSARACDPSDSPQLAELADWVEATYHFCRAGQYDRAYHVYYDKLEQGNELVLSWKLNAYSTIVGILEHFFPGNVTSEDPLVEDVRERRFLINRLGVCRMNLGRLREAPPLFQRAVTIAEEAGILKDQLHSSENLVEVYSYLGSLHVARRHAANAVRLAQELGKADELRDALACDAWIAHLTGEIEAANARFAEAERVQASIDASNPYLMSLYGIWHADHLRRTGNVVAAESQVERVFEYARLEDMRDDISQCWRLLGDIASARADHDTARRCYGEALKLARNMSEITVLLEALLARGRWAATVGAEEAQSDLDEALHYARGGSYGLYEADVRIGLARVKHAEGDKNGAIREAQRARELAAKSHYHWAEHESEALIAEISS
jgi:tetratricopeptide (TPR) repeat protein